LLNRLVRYLEVDEALELGTSLGLGTAALAAGNKVKITTIEGCPATAAVAREKFEEFGFKNIQLQVGKFEEILVDGGQWTEDGRIQDFDTSTQNRSSFAQASEDRQPATGNRQLATHNSELLTHNFDLLYIDGNHQKEATLSYFEKLLPTVHNDSVMIFDDIHWSRDMEEAWEEI